MQKKKKKTGRAVPPRVLLPLWLVGALLMLFPQAARGAAPSQPFLTERGRATLVADTAAEAEVVKTAARLLRRDWQAVFGAELPLVGPQTKADKATAGPRIVVGTLGAGRALRGCGVGLRELLGRREAFLVSVNRRGDLVVAGSDAHGTAYGLMELSRLIGVSPWEWWADCTPRPRDRFELAAGFRTLQWPRVDYRGFFINDEDWGFMPWASLIYEPSERPGMVGPRTTERVCELLLRLRANTYWPPMHECTYPFFLTPGNREVARRFGIYLGASHCEPMASSAAREWALRGEGDYNYVTNRSGVLRFWEERVREVASQEMIYTLGMRGLHDGAMQGARTAEEQRDVLTRVLSDQRDMLARLVNPRVERVPQVFIPYKEVLDAYRAGLSVPDDVTLVWCDDNYGYLRHLPTAAERQRSGGNGLYYHASYWGRPHDYLWLGTQSPALMLHQLGRAYDGGIRRLWILNVGDIKPLEYQTELFMDLAWNADSVRSQGLTCHLERFLAREFGAEAARRLVPLMQEYYRLCYICKPEFLGHTRTEERDPAYRRVSDLPWSEAYIRQRLDAFRRLREEAEAIAATMPADRHDAYFQLVGYPVGACASMNQKMLSAQLARHGLMDFSDAHWGEDQIVTLTYQYNDEKWLKMMDWRPRRLPVFDIVEERQDTTLLPLDPVLLLRRSATECATAHPHPCDGLGYYGGAAELTPRDTLIFPFEGAEGDSVDVLIGLVPTHPLVDNGHLRLDLSLDGGAPVRLSFETRGRSEEWKQNVLRNLAVRTLRLPLSAAASSHTLRLVAVDEGLVLDHVEVTR